MTKNKFGVGAKPIVENLVKPFFEPGAMVAMVSLTTPTGWLLCDGSVVSQSTYANLYSAIGSTYDTGAEGAGNFRLPNMADAFLISQGTGVSVIGSGSSHSHSLTANLSGAANNTNTTHGHTTSGSIPYASFDHGHGYVDAGANGGTDNNPVNANKTGTATSGISGAGHYHSIGAVGNTGAVNESQSHTHGHNMTSTTANTYSHTHSGSASVNATSSSSSIIPPSITARFYIKV